MRLDYTLTSIPSSELFFNVSLPVDEAGREKGTPSLSLVDTHAHKKNIRTKFELNF